MSEDDWLQRIAASPEDLGLRVVYADWLLAHGDQRGALIVAQSQGRTSTETELVKQHQAEWLGPHVTAAMWHLGFAVSITFGGSPAELAELLVRPAARLVAALILRGHSSEHIVALFEAAVKLRPRSVRVLGAVGQVHDPRVRQKLRELYPEVELPPLLLG